MALVTGPLAAGKIRSVPFASSRLLAFAGLRSAALAVLLAGAPARGQVVLNEVLAENGTSFADDDGDFSDWAEILNRGPGEAHLGGYGLSDDSSVPRKWVFPEVSMAPGGYLLVWLSGKDRYVPRPSIPGGSGSSAAFRATYIRAEDEWRYLVADPAAAGPPAGWTDPGFDDGVWPLGRSGFGYGDEDDFTELPADTGAVFIRRRFNVVDPSGVASLILRIDFDDGFIAFLNGARVASEGATQEAPTFRSQATIKREAGTPLLYDLTPHLGALRAGENVLAIAGLNALPSSDMSLLPELGTLPSFLHASFRLEKRGESLILTDPAGQTMDSIEFPVQTRDHSYGRSPGDPAAWKYFVEPTPERPNDGPAFDEALPDQVLFTPDAGGFSGPIALTLALNQTGPPGVEIRYSVDGSAPSAASAPYTGPIDVSENRVFSGCTYVTAAPPARRPRFGELGSLGRCGGRVGVESPAPWLKGAIGFPARDR